MNITRPELARTSTSAIAGPGFDTTRENVRALAAIVDASALVELCELVARLEPGYAREDLERLITGVLHGSFSHEVTCSSLKSTGDAGELCFRFDLHPAGRLSAIVIALRAANGKRDV